ncbi:hypothetical protein PR202_gb27992 [Eleusine coracana subsp. coracana]|uniref:Protein kinase domain-containing protein n=1 Tax=Eleusine coracana subsp. coracana TaxID=191504 RepID=A0AAV5FXM0_ELECO|nr:hypothetical protein PR202_gb27992 [Eleusine coracana subsp. coracana]
MAGLSSDAEPTEAFEYMLLERDPDLYRTVFSGPSQISPWIDPSVLNLKHRIGRGPFGDVWIATHHQRTEDYERYHEVAVKMLHPIKEDQLQLFSARFDEIFSKCRGLNNVCFLHGISTQNGRICIAMKFYEGSIGDKLARLKGGRLPLLDVLRLGTPNYMAPEQWQPSIRGPISYETDSWAFACSILEMLSGIQPWRGKSSEEIYQLVVLKKEKPIFPCSLPPDIENVLSGCFEYDFRHRPLMKDILHAFERKPGPTFDLVCFRLVFSAKHADHNSTSWDSSENARVDRPIPVSCTNWLLFKDNLQVGDEVRSRKLNTSCSPETMEIPDGTIVGLDDDGGHDNYVLVRVHGLHDPLKVRSSTVERVTYGFAAGDWVRLREEDKKRSQVGILHSIDRDGSVAVGLIGMDTLWKDPSEVEVEVVSFDKCDGIVKKYEHLEDFHWAVRPLFIAIGFFTALKLGMFAGKVIVRPRSRKVASISDQSVDHQQLQQEIHNSANVAWFPPPVANMFFGDGVTPSG